MPYLDPFIQALKDFRQGLTQLDANPYSPGSMPAAVWRSEMEKLVKTQEAQLQCSP